MEWPVLGISSYSKAGILSKAKGSLAFLALRGLAEIALEVEKVRLVELRLVGLSERVGASLKDLVEFEFRDEIELNEAFLLDFKIMLEEHLEVDVIISSNWWQRLRRIDSIFQSRLFFSTVTSCLRLYLFFIPRKVSH